MTEEKADTGIYTARWPERLSIRAFWFLKLGFYVGIGVFLLSVIIFGFEVCYLFSFLSFLASSVIGVVALIGLLQKQTLKKYYIRSTACIVIGLVAALAHFVIFYNIRTQNLLVMKRVQEVICRAKLETLSSHLLKSANDFQEWQKDHWCDIIRSQIENGQYFECPSDKIGSCSYAMNENIPMDANDLPPDLVLLFESASGWNNIGGPDDVVTDRHAKDECGANIAFADGHVEFVRTADISKLRWTLVTK